MIRRLSRLFLACLLAFNLGCANSLIDRSLVFSTSTSLGIEVSVDPANSSAPVNLLMGYKRYEGVLNPVFYDHNAYPLERGNVHPIHCELCGLDGESCPHNAPPTDLNSYYRLQAYSVLAKIRGNSSADAGDNVEGRIEVAQWFATGKAADILACQPGIAAAVSGSPEIAEALRGLDTERFPASSTVHAIASVSVYRMLSEAPFDNDPVAQAKLQQMDTSAVNLLTGQRGLIMGVYDFDSANNQLTVAAPRHAAPSDYEEVHSRYLEWINSADALAQAAKARNGGVTVTVVPHGSRPPAATIITQNNLSDLDDAASLYQSTAEDFGEAISNDAAIADAVEYVFSTLLKEE